MVPYNWDSAPKCNRCPNFMCDLIRESPIFPAANLAIEKIGDWKKLEILVQNQSF